MLDKQEYKAKKENISLEINGWFDGALSQKFALMVEKLSGKKNDRRQLAKRNVAEDEGKRFMELAEVFEKRLERARREKFTFLLVGRAGANRAKPMNALVGEEVVAEDERIHTSFQVTTYEHNEVESRFSIIDTPGLCDIPSGQGKDYIHQMRLEDGAPRFDGLWFVTPLLEAGITDGERHAIEIMTQAYGSDAWRYALIVLTYDGVLEQEHLYQKIYQEKMECIRQEIARLAGEEVAATIPAVSVACAAKTTPDRKQWVSELYVAASLRMSDQGYLSFLIATAKRLQFSPPNSRRARHAKVRTSSISAFSVAGENQKSAICIDEEKSRAIKRRIHTYLASVVKRKRIPPR